LQEGLQVEIELGETRLDAQRAQIQVFNVLDDFPLQIDDRETRGRRSRRNSLLLQALQQTVQAALLLQGLHEDARTWLCRHLLQMRLLPKIVQDKAHFEEAFENAQRRERLFSFATCAERSLRNADISKGT
jgi:hypothetical protein